MLGSLIFENCDTSTFDETRFVSPSKIDNFSKHLYIKPKLHGIPALEKQGWESIKKTKKWTYGRISEKW